MTVKLLGRLREAFWLVPALCVGVAAVSAVGLIEVDKHLQRNGGGLAFTGGPESARGLLGTIASSMLSLTALVFSITIVVLQLTSSQFSPRVLRTFLHDRQTQVTLGAFVATFTYAVIVLREVRGEGGLTGEFVPGLAVSTAFGLVLLSLVLFVAYIHHIANSIRVVTVLARIREEAEEVIDRLAPPGATHPRPPAQLPGAVVATAHRSGVVLAVDAGPLVGRARELGGVLRLACPVGAFVPAGAPLLLGPEGVELDERAARRAVSFGVERDGRQDLAFGLRQVVDIAERALSPGVNDPTTAVQCLDQLHALLRRLGTRPLPAGAHVDDEGVVRLVVPTPTWDDHVALACDEIRHWGAGSLQVHRRLRALLVDLVEAVAAERRAPLRRQLALLEARAVDLPEVERASLEWGAAGAAPGLAPGADDDREGWPTAAPPR